MSEPAGDELIGWAAPIVGRLPVFLEEPDEFVFDAGSAPALPARLVTDRIVVTYGRHSYDPGWRTDFLTLSAGKETLRAFGVAVLATLFGDPEAVTEVVLTDARSAIRTIRLAVWPDQTTPLLRLRPERFEYQPDRPGKHPWIPYDGDPWNLPMVQLFNADDRDDGPLDTVEGFGNYHGIARFGDLLLDASDPGAERLEYDLEGEAGFRGVSPMSAELRLALPGSLASAG